MSTIALPTNVSIPCLTINSYLLLTLLGSILVRIILSLVRAYRASSTPLGPTVSFPVALGAFLLGQDPQREPSSEKTKGQDHGDYGASLLLGWIELLIFPVLIVLGMHLYISSWIALKTATIYFRWKSDRVTFNLFLAGNALTVAIAWFLACYVSHVRP